MCHSQHLCPEGPGCIPGAAPRCLPIPAPSPRPGYTLRGQQACQWSSEGTAVSHLLGACALHEDAGPRRHLTRIEGPQLLLAGASCLRCGPSPRPPAPQVHGLPRTGGTPLTVDAPAPRVIATRHPNAC